MRNFIAIFACLFLLLLSLGTGLFQSVPFGSDGYIDRVFSRENILINLGLFVLAVMVVAFIYLTRNFVIDYLKKRTKNEKASQGLVIVVVGCLMVGFAMVFGLLQKLPFLGDIGLERLFSRDRVLLNSIIVVGMTMLAALSYWIKISIRNPYEDDEEEK